MDALIVHDLKFKRGDFQLGPIELTLQQGEIQALIGRNGSGKSTLIYCLLGLLQGEGTIHYSGGPASFSERSWKQDVGFVLENQTHLETLSVKDNLNFYSGIRKRWNHAFSSDLLKRLELSARTRLSQLSKGDRQKFNLIAAISHEPKYLLLDELTSGMDPLSTGLAIDVISDFSSKAETSVLMVTHSISPISRLCDRISVLSNGTITASHQKEVLQRAWGRLSFTFDREFKDVSGLVSKMTEGNQHLIISSDTGRSLDELKNLGAKNINQTNLSLEEISGYLI